MEQIGRGACHLYKLCISRAVSCWRNYVDASPRTGLSGCNSRQFTRDGLGLLRRFRARQYGWGHRQGRQVGVRYSGLGIRATGAQEEAQVRGAPDTCTRRRGRQRFKIRWKMDLHRRRLWRRYQIRCHFRRRDQQFGWQRASQFRRFDARFFHRIWQGHRCSRSPLRCHRHRDLHSRRRLQGPLDRDQEVGSNGYFLVYITAPVGKSVRRLPQCHQLQRQSRKSKSWQMR